MFINNINPVALSFGPIELRWYSLFFATGVVLYYFITRWMWKREKFVISDFENLVLFLFVGLVVGARLGEVFFYQWEYYSGAGFWEIFKVWKGGLSSHGATIGLVLAYAAFWGWKRWRARRLRAQPANSNRLGFAVEFSFAKYIDSIAVCMPLVAGFVRLGNFFNSEIGGRSFDGPWAVVFAQNGENFGRHPVQLYEGIWAWAVFAVAMGLWVKKEKMRALAMSARGEGILSRNYLFLFLFIGLYFAGRFGLEFFKEYQIGVGTDGLPWGLTMGQGLSVVPVVVAGTWFAWKRKSFYCSKRR